MKTGKIIKSTLVLLVFFGLNYSYGQWAPNGNHIFNTNTGNVGIGTGVLFTPVEKLHINTVSNTASIMAESSYTGTSMKALGYFRIKNTATGDMFNMVLRKNGAVHEMLQSCYDATAGLWREYAYYNYGTRKYEMRSGIFDVEFLNSGDMLINNAGNVGMGIVPDNFGLNVINYVSGKAAVQGLDQSAFVYATGMLGVLEPSLLGVPVDVVNAGVLGIKPNAGGNGVAVYGWNNDDNSLNYGGLFASDGEGTGTNYGTYSIAMHANNSFAGKFFGRVEVDGHPSAAEAPDYNATVFKATVNHTESVDTKAVEGVSSPNPGYGIGVQGTGGWMGVAGYANGGAYTGTNYAVYGYANGTAGTRIGVYGNAYGGTTNWAGYFDGDAYISSDLRIATTTQATGYSLSVNGKIACEEVFLGDIDSWPDYVFSDDYDLMSIEELEQSIQRNKHLPGIPSAAEIEENGLMLGDMQKRLIEKVEELTLYTIQQGKMINELREKMENLEKENANLRESISK